MYGTSEVNANTVGRPFFMAGITENVELSKVAFENSKTDGTGKDVLTFTFTGPTGAEFRKIFWEVDPSRTIEMNQKYPRQHARDNSKIGAKKGETISDEQAVLLAYDEFNRHIKHIMTKYMSDEEAIISNVSSYKDFAMAVIKKLTGKFNGKKMRLKIVFDKRDYLDIPRFGNYLESMETTPTTIMINYTYDKLKRSEPTPEAEVSAAAEASTTATNDLPF